MRIKYIKHIKRSLKDEFNTKSIVKGKHQLQLLTLKMS